MPSELTVGEELWKVLQGEKIGIYLCTEAHKIWDKCEIETFFSLQYLQNREKEGHFTIREA